jgi:hypothetical protein
MNEKTGSFELLEPVSPEALVPDSWVEPWMIVLAAVVVLALVAALVFALRKKPVVNLRSVRMAAHAEAVAALGAINATEAREAAVQSSLILRKYLVAVANDPALFETHEETISRHEAFQGFSDQARLTTQGGFTRLAALKYAAHVPEVAAGNVIAESRALLETLHHGFLA